MKLYLVRHGETDENRQGIIMGWADASLNFLGLEEAKLAADSFNYVVDAIFCSDLKRCQQTARYFQDKLPDKPLFLDWRLRERYLGQAQGKSREEVFAGGRNEANAADVETLDNYRLRVRSFLDSLRLLPVHFSKILVVTHNGTINRMMELSGRSNDPYHSYDNGEVVELEL